MIRSDSLFFFILISQANLQNKLNTFSSTSNLIHQTILTMAGDCGCSGASSCNCGSSCSCSGCGK
ncbi:hypothetical protein DER46DRAFT_698593 [Fusarium sp. MPI-SDFR-AT-0072]|nr:hypothetical protein DER46DRAFT_698593 [Fusarium sp. MPI-SDFR-AT-0072]